jgi:hypothetical protein
MLGRAQPRVARSQTGLDDTLGDETIWGVGCERPFDVEALRQALERAPDQAPHPPGWHVETLVVHVVHKETRGCEGHYVT